jgi:release factor glutamine methyltransferase
MRNSVASSGDDWTIIKLLGWTTSYFASRAIESPRAGAEILLAHVLNLQRVDLYLRFDQPLTQTERERYKALIRRRVRREPVAYITGCREFWSMNLTVSGDVLIPRPETECLVEQVLAELSSEDTAEPSRILELGTGSGAIILALASSLCRSVCFASDVSERSVRVARENARRHGLDGRVQFFCGDWTGPLRLSGVFDVIVSNPPYIPTGQIKTLEPEIHLYEPLRALDGGYDGLASVRRLITQAHRFMRPGGRLLLEIGHDQQEAVRQIAATAGQYEDSLFTKDYAGYNRVVRMRKKASGPCTIR